MGWRTTAALAIGVAALTGGCSAIGSTSPAASVSVSASSASADPIASASASPGTTPAETDAAADYWTRDRLLNAQPWRRWALPRLADGSPGVSPTAHAPALEAPRVGALFEHSASGNHFCTASVVASPGHDLLITAAHCIHSGKGGGYNQDIVFIPGYQDGATPYGVWTPSKLLVDEQWAKSSDPDHDVGFVVLHPNNGQNIQDVIGSNDIRFDAGYSNLVRVTGYPSGGNAPVTCKNWTSMQSQTQLRFECGGFFGGTSGSPWVTDFNPRTRTGAIIGVIGGYQSGGDTDAISYSVYLDGAVRKLYEKAETLS
jgi:V8-like Glu-specific endopeptidase